MSSSLEKIKSQVEFYFSDANFRVDTFLRQQSLLNDGYIPISVILTFQRMKNLGATVESVKEAVKESKVVEMKGESIKKIETEEYKKYLTDDADKRVVYITGFDTSSTLEEVSAILTAYMKPVLIRMRRGKKKEFTGSVFVELKTEEEVKEAIKQKIEQAQKEDQTEDRQEQKEDQTEDRQEQKEDQTEDRQEEDSRKRIKTSSFLTIIKKEDYKSRKGEREEEKARRSLVEDYSTKLFYYKVEEGEENIANIKKAVGDVAFVDLEKKALRMKYSREYEEKEVEKEGMKIRLEKMKKEEVEEYCKGIKVGASRKSNKGKTGRKQK